MNNPEKRTNGVLNPPLKKSGNVISDVKNFFLKVPAYNTFVEINSEDDRNRFMEIISKRLGVGVDNYKVLNIHRISINTPTEFVFNELLTWDGNSSWWPNHISKANLTNGNLEKIKITLFGLSQNLFKLKNGVFGYHLLHLFNLSAIKFQREPDINNARYLLYRCSGGYPIGVFALYVRDSIKEQKEEGLSQLFAVVGFNFYGKKSISGLNFLHRTWEGIHNRVTANVLDRIKLICEWDYNQSINKKNC